METNFGIIVSILSKYHILLPYQLFFKYIDLEGWKWIKVQVQKITRPKFSVPRIYNIQVFTATIFYFRRECTKVWTASRFFYNPRVGIRYTQLKDSFQENVILRFNHSK
uniref:Uncharacterized protein n=1 Tax=Cacopsylla melanoneura TaxID=428564 RepID=A0A8D9AZ18_9HEMI